MPDPRLRNPARFALLAILVKYVGDFILVIPMALAGDCLCEAILLPFAAEPSGAHPVLVHINWKPEYMLRIESPGQAMGSPLDFRVVALG